MVSNCQNQLNIKVNYGVNKVSSLDQRRGHLTTKLKHWDQWDHESTARSYFAHLKHWRSGAIAKMIQIIKGKARYITRYINAPQCFSPASETTYRLHGFVKSIRCLWCRNKSLGSIYILCVGLSFLYHWDHLHQLARSQHNLERS